MADIYLDIADFYANQQETEKSLSHYEQALSICEQINSKEKVADILYSIGKLHYNNNNFIEVLWPYEKAPSILNQLIAEQSKKRYYEKMATIYFDIAGFHHQVKEFQEVLPFYQKALKIRIALFGQNNLEVAAVCKSMANFHKEHLYYPESLSLYERVLAIKKCRLSAR